jgi:tetratricopeptide (TPR) repeat protein
MKKTLILILVGLMPIAALPQGNALEEAEKLYNQGLQLQNVNSHEAAINHFTRCLTVYPKLADAYAARADSKLYLKDYEGALIDLNIYLELVPDQYEVLLGRATLLFRMNRFTYARKDFKNLLKLSPGETTTVFYRKSAHSEGTDQIMTAQGNLLRPQVYSYLGLIELKFNNCTRAIRYLDSAIALNNTEADFYSNRALAKESCNNKSATSDYVKALAINPNHALTKHNMAQASRKTNDVDAEILLTEVIKGDSSLYYSWAERAYYRMTIKNYTGALSDYTTAIKLNATDADTWMNRGLVKEKLSDLKGAYTDYTKAIALKEDLVKAWLNRGNVLMKEQRYQTAIEDYTAAISFEHDYGAAYYNRAIAYYRLKKLSEACADLRIAEELGVKINASTKSLICK